MTSVHQDAVKPGADRAGVPEAALPFQSMTDGGLYGIQSLVRIFQNAVGQPVKSRLIFNQILRQRVFLCHIDVPFCLF